MGLTTFGTAPKLSPTSLASTSPGCAVAQTQMPLTARYRASFPNLNLNPGPSAREMQAPLHRAVCEFWTNRSMEILRFHNSN
jgi:hypothetical protein